MLKIVCAVLLFAAVCSADVVKPCEGVLVDKFLKLPSQWYNELGSTMTLTSLDPFKGNFAGKYKSAVGNAGHEYDLVGKFDTHGGTLGWIVSYQNKYLNAHSTCTWSGHIELSPCKDQRPVILTTWLLTSQTGNKDDWPSTNVGFDTFTEYPPSQEQIEKAKLRRQFSHPKRAFME
ncbi:Hypothetical predicted protein [Paramuricea clavata]|uniref:Uncharacterized protein n=1 Tax=Paramuricea clavata TaxID=317549 RepID=A0A7D9E500_PARCT|nr:Hypothetical predicted protein [Paramuricea clavata]